MTIPTVLALSLSFLALFTSMSALYAWRRSSARSQSVQLSELLETVESLTVQLRNMRARLNMQTHRAKKAGQSSASAEPTDNGDEASQDDAWKRTVARQQLGMREL